MPDTTPTPVAIRLVLSPAIIAALDQTTETTGMDRTNIIRAALVEWIDRHPDWVNASTAAPDRKRPGRR